MSAEAEPSRAEVAEWLLSQIDERFVEAGPSRMRGSGVLLLLSDGGFVWERDAETAVRVAMLREREESGG